MRHKTRHASSTRHTTTRQGSVQAVDLKSYHVLPPLLRGSTFGLMDYDAVTGQVYIPDLQQKRNIAAGAIVVVTVLILIMPKRQRPAPPAAKK